LSGPNDGLPVTCVSVDLARRYCQARGGDLPTMAQLEYVRGALAGQPYVWGFDAPTCDSAIWGRNPDGDITCAALGLGPRPPGSAARDRLRLAGGEIVDLAGNVAELLVDQTSKECRRAGVFRDPRCGAPGGVAAGSYAGDVVELLAPARLLFVSLPDPKVGFRCARPATP
jgi:formylglycine-generating enzyme required for sulfatase activity